MVSNDTLKNFRTTQNNSDCTASFTLNSSETHTNYTYNAENSIATESNYTVSELNNEIRMKAGKVIVLKPKTLIRKNSLYLARIVPCIACEISFSYPKFFTPNNDGVNDYWKIKWTTASDFSEVSIFDRYGKLLKILKNLKIIGTDNLTEQMFFLPIIGFDSNMMTVTEYEKNINHISL